MKSEMSYRMHRPSKYLVACLASLLAVSAPALRAASDADVQKLQDENAALRRRLAQLEGNAEAGTTTTTTTTTTSTGTTTAPAAGSLGTDEGVTTLGAFKVNSDKDRGYLKTNAVTATRIGVEVQRTPLAIEIKSKEFLDDTNTQTITDILRYTSSGSGDNQFRMARPANGATPQGNFTMRGFQVTSLLRNGVTRYGSWTLDNVERVEIVKGPAALFFGSGAPGGIINYITKQPVFARIPTTVTAINGSDKKHKYVIDTNQQFSRKAAMRIIYANENSGGDRKFEYEQLDSLTGSLAIVPFDSGRLKITFEGEHTDERFNENRQDWYYPQGWFQAYSNPTSALEQAGGVTAANVGTAAGATAYQARIFDSPGNWGNDMRASTGNLTAATYTNIEQGAYYTDKNGNVIHDEGFNYTNRGAYTHNNINVVDTTVEFSPFDWLDTRYVLTKDYSRFDSVEDIMRPYADERTWKSQLDSTAGYYRKISDHQIDLIFKKDFWGIKNKLLVGGFFRENFQQYMANNQGIYSPLYANVPGATNSLGNPGGTLSGTTYTGGIYAPVTYTGQVPVNQVIRDRYGNVKTVLQVYSAYDPGFEIQPDVSVTSPVNRTALDGYYVQQQAGYINYQGQLLDDRLTILAGVRREMNRDSGQYLTANFPWYAPPPYAFAQQNTYDPSAYNYGPSYSGDVASQFDRVAGTSFMAGLSFQVAKDINVYASTSKIFNRNGSSNAGGYSTLQVPQIVQDAQAYLSTLPGGLAANPFIYRGKTINNTQDLLDELHAIGADVLIPPETGRNAEIGVKSSLWDNKLTGTLSVFHMFRVNRRFEDTAAQNSEPLNGANNYVYFGPPAATSTYVDPTGLNFRGTRLLRWRYVGQKDIVEGTDGEVIWTPTRNFQMVVNGAWLWTAKTDINPTIAKPGSAAYNALTPAARINNDIQYGARLENVPEFRLNTFSTYTFTDGILSGLKLGIGTRYSSKMVTSRSVDWNPLTNGFQTGNYLVFDSTVSYPWEVLGYKISTSVNMQNVTDKLYFEGSVAASPGRQLFISNTLKF